MSRPDDRKPILSDAPPPYAQPNAPQGGPPPHYEPGKGDYSATATTYQEGAYPPAGYQTTQPTVILVTTVLGPNPAQMQCPHCEAHIMTATEYQAGGLTWLVAGILCIFGCWLGCCLIPFCIQDAQDVEHTCPNCHRLVGRYKRI